MKNYLIVDLGTGNTKVAIVTSQKTIIDLETIENKYCVDDSYEDAQYFVPNDWRDAILEVAERLVAKHKDITIDGITSAGARESIVLYDKEGNAFLGLPNIDNRGRAFVSEIEEKPYIYEKTGRWVTEDFPAAKLLGLRKVKPEIFAKLDKITSLSEWVGEVFTGKIAFEPSQACETQLYDIDEKCWSKKLCFLYGIDENILPPLKNAGELLGTSLNKFKDLLGLENVPFVVGGADTQIAIRSTKTSIGDVAVVSGTTSPVVRLSDEVYHDEKERCWTDINLKAKSYQIETNPGVTGLNYQRSKKNFFPNESYENIENEIAKKTSVVVTASFSSLNFSERQSLKTGGFIMRSPYQANVDMYDYMYAVVADIACSIYRQYNNLCKMLPHNKDYIYACGGGFQSKNLCQMLSNLTGKTVIICEGFSQSTIFGCMNVINEYFGIISEEAFADYKRFTPNDNTLIKDYYEVWLKNRKLLN